VSQRWNRPWASVTTQRASADTATGN
jgi:hypothetical protein